MSNAVTGSPISRIQEAKKQLGIALEDIDDEDAIIDIMTAAVDTERALQTLDRKDVDGTTGAEEGGL